MAKATRIAKVFAAGDEQAELAKKHEVIQAYDSFVLLRVTVSSVDQLASQYPLEDITEHFKIRVGDQTINTNRPRIDADGRVHPHPAYKGVKKLTPGKHHYLVQFVGPIKQQWLSKLKRLGAEPRSPFQEYVYVVRCSDATVLKVARQSFVRWMGHLSHKGRIDIIKGATLPRTRHLPGAYTVEFFGSSEMTKAATAIRKLGVDLLSKDTKACIMTVDVNGSVAKVKRILSKLSAVHGVRAIRRRAIKRTSNNIAGTIMNTSRALSTPLDLTGKGEVIAVCDSGLDTGDINNMHPDFRGRVVAIRSYPINPYYNNRIRNPGANDGPADLDSGHGTHVAGSALGSGAASTSTQDATIQGLARKAKLIFQAVEQEMKWKSFWDERLNGRFVLSGLPDDLTPLFDYAYRKGARIHSNSWSGGAPGEYDEQCRQLDNYVWKKKDFCVLVAAGNDGTDQRNPTGEIDLQSVTAPGTAKNCITVGACESERTQFNGETYGEWWPNDYPHPPYRNAPMANSSNQVVAFSSRGPTRDGRVKPDVVAPGTFILSTRSRKLSPGDTAWAPYPPNNLYFYMGGTSMATPLTAGAVALLREFLREWVGYESPSAALVKASLILGAVKLRGYSSRREVHDNHQGYGRVDLDAIVAPPHPTVVYFIDDRWGLATGQSDEFKFDVRSSAVPLRVALAYSDYPGEALVNDLNLMLRSPTGRSYVGNGRPGGPLQLDSTDNTEVVQINNPVQGKWIVRIVASNVPHARQDYAFVVSGNVRA